MQHSLTLNVPINLSTQDWEKVASVYRELEGWIESDEDCWFGHEGDSCFITASAEPSGLVFCGQMESSLWAGWTSVLCAKLSAALGRNIHDAET